MPLSFAQQRLWFLDQIEGKSSLYNIPMTFELLGHLDAEVLRQSLDALVERHEVLRTSFPSVGGSPYQAISGNTSAAWEWGEEDLSVLDNADAAHERAESEARRPFHLETGPLFRIRLFRRGEEDHVLQVTMHHTVSDAWSMGVFLGELSALYGAFLAGEPSPLPPLPIQYADFATWQREWLQGEVLEEQLSYWRDQLADLTPTELPTDRPRPAVQSFRGATHPLRLRPELVQALRTLGRHHGSTLYMTIMAAFKTLLHRYSSQTDVVVGTPFSGRNRSEIEGLVGMFVNTLVIRSDLTADPSFLELLGRVRDASLEAHAHQDLPFEKLVEELQPERDLSRNPLFQVMFTLQNPPGGELALPGLDVGPVYVEQDTSKFDLTLFLWEATDGGKGEVIEGVWEYATDLFDEATIERMQRHFEALLEAIVADPSCRISELELMAEKERRQLLEQWNSTELEVPEGVCIHHLFEARVGEDPDRVAVVAKDGSLTYGELESRANQLGRHLVGLGVTGETLVGVSLPRTTEMVVAVLGILKAGGAYLPLDPDLPAERLSYILEDGGAPMLVTNTEVLESFPPFSGGVVCVDGDRQAIASLSAAPHGVAVDPDQLAYVIYTSGSTGRPKGVEVTHANVVNFLLSLAECPGLSADDVLLAVAAISFDGSVLEFFGPLSVGGRLVLASWEVIRDGRRLRALVGEAGINLIECTPATLRMLFDAGWQGDKGLRVWMGGEAVPLDLARKLRAGCGEVWNIYGPTETTVAATGWRVPADVDEIRIGTPLANYQVYVLDHRMQQMPVGVPGELYIGGVGVARGYRNRPELTAERFVPDRFGTDKNARLYRTGDRVRFRDDGTLEFMGRLDNQVKIRGYRIELGEIEARLGEHEAVRQVAVMVYGEEIDARLVAYVVFEEGNGFDLPEMRRILCRFLPEYMVPSLLVELDEIPLTPSGKVDRKAFPDPETSASAEDATFVAPRTPTEESLAGIWAEVLGRERVGVHDDFFGLGGHSLRATQVISRMVRDMEVELPLRSLFESSTVAELAERIEAFRYVAEVQGPSDGGPLEEVEI